MKASVNEMHTLLFEKAESAFPEICAIRLTCQWLLWKRQRS